MYASNQVGGKQVLLLCPAYTTIAVSRQLGDPFDGIAQHVFVVSERDVAVGKIGRFRAGLDRDHLLCIVGPVTFWNELKLAAIEVEVESGLAVVADPDFRLETAFDDDWIALLDVLGDDFCGVAEEVGFVPDRRVFLILTGAAFVVRAD